MMVKLSILVALLGALLVVASATRWDPDRGSRGSRWDAPSRGDDQCQRQLQRANLRPCEEHMRRRVEQEQEQEQDEYPYSRRGSRGRQPGESDENQEQRCCNELNRFQNNQRCMCQALQQILQNQSFWVPAGQEPVASDGEGAQELAPELRVQVTKPLRPL
uniref:Allergen n=1 Tax=Arachis hypogaea TaxID=3818 RepID=Q9SQH1_ARAHY|nr:allergen [Arachis hypogaea]